MNKSQSAITTMVVVAGVANSYGAVRKSKDITYPVLGGFIVLILLLVMAQANAKVAEMFAGAYAVTSFLLNGADLVNSVTGFVNPATPRFDPGGQTVKSANNPVAVAHSNGVNATGTAVAVPAGAVVIPAPTYSLPSPGSSPSSTTYSV